MPKRILLSAAGIMLLQIAIADSPGKKEMHESKVSFQNVQQLAGYTFYYQFHYSGNTGTFTADTTLVIPPSGGAPDGVELWAINNKTKKSTDTITFNNYYSPDEVIIISGLKNDSITYTKTGLSNSNEIVSDTNTAVITNKELVKEAESVKKNHYYKIAAYSGAALIALAALVWFFIRRRNKNTA
jgi:hypothetical protein